MATKLQKVSSLMEQTTKRVTGSPQEWTGFLQTAARLYKYPFEEQILIYAQRPDATACATIEFWNKHMGRWVNRGAKGITLIDDSTGKTTLKHVFDVSDTHSLAHAPFRLWEINKTYQEQLIEELADQFGDADETTTGFDSQLRDIIRNAVQDNMSDYFAELLTGRDGSYLADLDELNAGVVFKETVTDSVTYMVHSRLGLDTKALPEDLFKDIYNFNTFDTVMQLGGATSDISEMVLRQIERTIKSIERKKQDVLDEALPLKDNNIKESERSGEHGNHIHTTGRIPDTRLDAGRIGDTPHWQIRDAEEVVPQEPQERDIRWAAAVGEAGQPFSGDRSDGARTGGSDNDKDGERAGSDRKTESRRSDEMGGTHEQPETSGGGASAERPDLQLEWYDRGTEDKSLPFFSFLKVDQCTVAHDTTSQSNQARNRRFLCRS